MDDPLIAPRWAEACQGPVMCAVLRRSGRVRHTREHRHARGQLLGTEAGLLTVQAARHRWIVPASHAVWVPPQTLHATHSHGPFAGWSVYLAPEACAALPAEPCVLALTPLLRAAVGHAAHLAADGTTDPQRLERLAAVMLDEITASTPLPWSVPMPSDRRLRRIAQALCEHPGDPRPLADWARWAGLSSRTASRRFVAETGHRFTHWRQRLRLLHAAGRLAEGVPVAAVAAESGYRNPSSFIAVFREVFGTTPGHYAATSPGRRR